MSWNSEKYNGLSLVIIRYCNPFSQNPEHIILSVDLGKKPPLWDRFVGGKIERGESAEQAAWREMNEESGLDINESLSYGKLGETLGYNEAYNRSYPVHLYEVEFGLDEIDKSLLKVSEEGDLISCVPVSTLPDRIHNFHPEHLLYLKKIAPTLYTYLFEDQA